MKETINVVCAADNNYAPLCGIMLTSLLESNRDSHVEAYVLTADISSGNSGKLEQLAERGGYDARIHVCRVSDRSFDGCPVRSGDHISLAAYYRFLIPSILPIDVHKALYMDCDVMVRDSLGELMDTDLTGFALAACTEYDESLGFMLSADNIDRLGYPKEWGYFKGCSIN